MRYRVKLKKSEEGYAVWCPGLPGCWSQGQTEEEALDNIKDAIAVFLKTIDETNKDAGLTIQEFELKDLNNFYKELASSKNALV